MYIDLLVLPQIHIQMYVLCIGMFACDNVQMEVAIFLPDQFFFTNLPMNRVTIPNVFLP